MKFGIIAQGSNGDIEMLIALALGLVNRGHHVEIFIISFNNRDYSFLKGEKGLTVFQKHIYETYRNEMDDFEFWNDKVEYKGFYFTLHESFKTDLEDYALQFARHNDCIISLYHIYEASCIAQMLQIPYISVNFPMGHIRSAHESPLLLENEEVKDREILWNRFENLQNEFYKRSINIFRRRFGVKHEDVPVLKRVENVVRQVMTSSLLNLIPYSKSFSRQKPDANPLYQFCGYLKSPDNAADWTPPNDLLSFMETEQPPIFMTVGSMVENENDLEKLHSILLEAARRIDRRVIYLSNWRSGNAITENVYQLTGFVSYNMILSKCAFAVHHGGLGIMHHALESGCPSVIIKYGHDQFYNAKLLFDLGLSSGSIDRKEVTSEALYQLINTGLKDKSMKRNAEEFGKEMCQENGVVKAVELIEATLVRNMKVEGSIL